MNAIQSAKATLAEVQAKSSAYRSRNNEGGYGYNPYENEEMEAIRAVVAAELADRVARYPEIKAAWNAAIAKHTVNGQIDMRQLPQIEKEVGVTMAQIRELKAMVG